MNTNAEQKLKDVVKAGNELLDLMRAELGLTGDFKLTEDAVSNLSDSGVVQLTQLSNQLSERSLDFEDVHDDLKE